MYIHIHHYCSGIYAEYKVKTTLDQRARKRWLRLLISQMQYVSNRCQAGCILYPELHTRWGWALSEQGQPVEAINHYQLAIRAKPTYTTAYARLAALHVKLNQPDEARRVLEAGLKANPGSRGLQQRLGKLQTSQ